MQKVLFKDLGKMDYRSAWDFQEVLLQENVAIKSNRLRRDELKFTGSETLAQSSAFAGQTDPVSGSALVVAEPGLTTINHLLFVEHPPVYTLGKSGREENILISEAEREQRSIAFFRTNRGGDITFHGPEQLVGYPVLDLEQFYTDIGRYLRNLEEVIILTMSEFGLKGERSPGETGVWLDANKKGFERKICAMGVRCSRWVTMHGFAFNVNTDLSYFDYIIPCGIKDKAVTSLEKELGKKVEMEDVKESVKRNFEKVFAVVLV